MSNTEIYIETSDTESKEALVQRFQDGEMNAFDEIVERYRKNIYNLAYHFTHNCDDAYDISQEVFTKVFKSLNRLKDSSAFDTWLRRIAVNTCIDYIRQRSDEKNSIDTPYIGHIADSVSDPPNRPMELRELREVILRAVDRLPEKQREVFILRHYEHLSLGEIAQTVKSSQGTVKANLFHATRRLRKLLSPYLC